MDLFWLDPDHLTRLAEDRREQYRTADPFPHAVIDDFLPEQVLDEVIAEFPGPRDLDWQRFDSEQEKKLATEDPGVVPPFTRQVLAELNSAAMIDFLEQLTGIDGLIPDPHLWGGGLHQIEAGGRLGIHADFNWHKRLLLDRRLNLLLYLNRDWDPEWGGNLELWDRDMTSCRQRILPVANRCVIFSTTDYSFHGHPDPVTCPPDRSRRSLALYYYSNGRPASEVSASRTTAFQPRPGEQWRRPASPTASTLARFVPPIIADGVRSAKAARQARRST